MMNTNFCFLKKVDNDLYRIILDAEKLYRDEYFEQCVTQTRKFAENLCTKTLGYSCESFDQTLATLSDKMSGSHEEKEFIDDLYFLKKQGNKSVHSVSSKTDGMLALECLQRAFETALNFSVYKAGAKSTLLNRRFDIDLLVTGKKSQKTLADKYLQEKQRSFTKRNYKQIKGPQISAIKSEKVEENKISFYWYLVGFSFIVSVIAMIIISI